ncbi:hypothetical protein BGZ95_002278 [Linnemannia exigua]|uniref:Uncharacterized protein n=1 Tax=Linnemannia exigua TaxID=604196 RepID=A0AAD4DIL9_9FUNG|nr:hypothetical protein BGZ95_002278 [Linnemannia exigua]
MGAVASAGQDKDNLLSPGPATAPAFMHIGDGSSTDSWRYKAQESFPLSSGSTVSMASTITTTTATTEATSGSSINNNSGSGVIRIKNAWNGTRRASTASILIGLSPSLGGPLSPTREQHRRKIKSPLMTAAATSAYAAATASKKKNGMTLSPPSSPSRTKKPVIAVRDLSGELVASDSSYTTDDSGAASNEEESTSTDPSSSSSLKSSSSSDGTAALASPSTPKSQEIKTPTSPIRARIPKKSSAAEDNSPKSPKEYRFSTATLVKDGKLYYQVQWDQFSEMGFGQSSSSELFTEPEPQQSSFPLSSSVMSSSVLSSSQEDPWKQSSIVDSTAAEKQQQISAGQSQQQQQQQRAMTAHSDLPGQQQQPQLQPSPSQLGYQDARNNNKSQGQQDQGPSPAQRAAALKAAQESFIALSKDPKKMAALKAGASGTGAGQATVISSGSFVRGSTMPLLDSVPRAVNSPELMKAPPVNPQQARSKTMPLSPKVSGGSGAGSSLSSSLDKRSASSELPPISGTIKATKSKSGLFGKKFKASKKTTTPTTTTSSPSAGLPSSTNGNGGGRKRRLLPLGVRRQDVMTRTVEKMDEVFPWMCIEHMAGQESGWVMLEPVVQEGAVGWVEQEGQQQVRPFESQAVLQVEVA